MKIIDRCFASARAGSYTVVLPEGRDGRIIAAARRIVDEGLARPIVIGTPEQIAAGADGVSLDGIGVVNPTGSELFQPYAEAYAARRGLDIGVARRLIAKPMFFGGMMVAGGQADAMVGGAASATTTVIQSAVLTVGYAPGISTASSFFLVVIPEFAGERDKPFIYADCAVNVDPTAEQLADIAIASGASAAGLLPEAPRVAMLSFSTKGSANHPHVRKVAEAVELAKGRAGGLLIDGEFQADAAIDARVAGKKVRGPSEVAGRANVLIFPDLNTGNAAYKLTQYMSGARAIGPFLQGFARPISDLSRGATVEDIVTTAAITLAQADGA